MGCVDGDAATVSSGWITNPTRVVPIAKPADRRSRRAVRVGVSGRRGAGAARRARWPRRADCAGRAQLSPERAADAWREVSANRTRWVAVLTVDRSPSTPIAARNPATATERPTSQAQFVRDAYWCDDATRSEVYSALARRVCWYGQANPDSRRLLVDVGSPLRDRADWFLAARRPGGSGEAGEPDGRAPVILP